VLPVLATEIDELPAVLSVEAVRHAGQQSRKQAVETGDVPAVDDGGAKLSKEAIEVRHHGARAPFVDSKRQNVHVGTLDPIAALRLIGEAHDQVSVPVVRNPVHEVDEAVLQSPHDQVIDHMSDQRWLAAGAAVPAHRLNPSTAARNPWSDAPQAMPM